MTFCASRQDYFQSYVTFVLIRITEATYNHLTILLYTFLKLYKRWDHMQLTNNVLLSLIYERTYHLLRNATNQRILIQIENNHFFKKKSYENSLIFFLNVIKLEVSTFNILSIF